MSKIKSFAANAVQPSAAVGTAANFDPVGITREGVGRWSASLQSPADSITTLVASVNFSMKPNGITLVEGVGRCSVSVTHPVYSRTLVQGNGSTPATDKYRYDLIGMARFQEGQFSFPKGTSSAVATALSTTCQAIVKFGCQDHLASANGEMLYG